MKRQTIILSILLFLGISTIKAQDTLSISKAVMEALEQNFSISIAESSLLSAQINNTIGNAGMLPKLDLTGTRSLSVNNSHQVYFDGRLKDVSNAKTNNQSAGLQLSWTFFDGFNMFIQKDKLEEMEKLSDIQLRSVTESIVSQVVQAYYNIVLQQKLSDVYKEALHLSTERRNISKAKYDLGKGSELAMLQATVDMNADSANYIRQQGVVENAKSDLNLLLCRELDTPFKVSNDIPFSGNLAYNELWNEVQAQNLDLMGARSAVELAALSVKETRSAQLPKLNFNSGYSYNRSTSDASIYSTNRNYGMSVGVTLSYNLFNGFINRQKIKTAHIKEESARTAEELTRREVEATLKQVYTDFQTNLRLVAFEKESLQFARHSFTIAQEKYRLGVYSDIELRDTQKKLIDAENRLLTAMFRCKAAETELLRISGKLSGTTEQ